MEGHPEDIPLLMHRCEVVYLLFRYGESLCGEMRNRVLNRITKIMEERKLNSQNNRQWVALEPTEIKNAVELFNNDWMVLASGKPGHFNAMTISWGQMGELWGKPVVTVFVRDSRYTKEFLDEYGHFSLCAFPDTYHKALGYIGSHSGRDGDKLSVVDLHPGFTALGNPTFQEAVLCMECRTMYRHRMLKEELPAEALHWYEDGDFHTMYIAEILNVMKR